jgi:hypothetical protein
MPASEQRESLMITAKPRGRPWPKGISGNPAGRPHGSRNALQSMSAEATDRIIQKIIRQARSREATIIVLIDGETSHDKEEIR